MLANDYDLNLYGNSQHTMRLTAYRLMFDFEGNICTNYDTEWFTLDLERKADGQIIRELVNNDAFYNMHLVADYTDHDEWYSLEELTSSSLPTKLSEWLNNLPDYEMVDQRELK